MVCYPLYNGNHFDIYFKLFHFRFSKLEKKSSKLNYNMYILYMLRPYCVTSYLDNILCLRYLTQCNNIHNHIALLNLKALLYLHQI